MIPKLKRCLFHGPVKAAERTRSSGLLNFSSTIQQVRHAAVPRAVGTGRTNTVLPNSTAAATVAKPNDPDAWNSEIGRLDLKYEEYFVEHEISTVEARKAAMLLNLDNGE